MRSQKLPWNYASFKKAALTRHSQIRTKHEDNPFTLICSVVSCSNLFIFHAGSRGLASNNFPNSSYKEKTASLACVSRHYHPTSYDYGSS